MKRLTLLGLAVLIICCPLSAQTTESSLRALYGKPINGTFVVNANVKLKPVYGSHHRACVLTISGPISEQDLMKVFEAAVPWQTRGIQKQEFLQCVGDCERLLDFENVEFFSGVVGTAQTSDPDALVIFKRKDCETAAKAAKAIRFSMRRTER